MADIAEVRYGCGRCYLSVAGIAVAMQGDACRESLPDEVAEPIPEAEMESATIGGQPIKGMTRSEIAFFRGERWTEKSLQWAADKINAAANQA